MVLLGPRGGGRANNASRVSRPRLAGSPRQSARDFFAFVFPLDRPKVGPSPSHKFFPSARASRSPVTMDVMFELFDNEFLITNDAVHHIANRNYAN
jgi:hypothetical protein